jgi:hypothetical protein
MRAAIKIQFYTGARNNSQGLKLMLNYFNFLLSLFTGCDQQLEKLRIDLQVMY